MQREPPEIAQRFRTRTLFGCSRGPDCRSLPHPSAFPEYLIHSSRHRYHRASLSTVRVIATRARRTSRRRVARGSYRRLERTGRGHPQAPYSYTFAAPRPLPVRLRPSAPARRARQEPRTARRRARTRPPGQHGVDARRDRHVGVHDEEVLSMQ